MIRHHHNTTNELPRELSFLEKAAKTQDERVAAVFHKYAAYIVGMSPSQVHERMHTSAPLTSIRRAITNLTNAGILERTEDKVRGPYGRPEYRWKLVRQPQQPSLF